MTTILSHAVVLSVIQMFLFLVTPVAFGQDVSCYRTLDTLRVERDARVARCGDGVQVSTTRARCITNAETIYRNAVEALACRPASLAPRAGHFVKRVTVPAREGLVDTGIDISTVIATDCEVGIRTTGLWSNAGPPALGAGGFIGYRHPGTILAGADLASLVGVLSGPNSNAPTPDSAIVMFPIGQATSVSFTPANERFPQGPSVGRLLLAINDVEGMFDDNAGSLIVDVSVPSACAEVSTTVAASREWTDTALALPAGTQVTVRTSGAWSNAGPPATVTAAGFAGYRSPGQRYASADFASLIGSIGSMPLLIGAAPKLRLPAGGVLQLGMNDAPGTFADNVGALEVVIGGTFSCNGDEALCDRPYNQVAYATTHNSFATPGYLFPNQQSGIKEQLAGGIRGFMLDTLKDGRTVGLCHVACVFHRIPLDKGLKEFFEFLHVNRHEVVTIILENRVAPARIAEIFEQVGLTRYVHVQGDGPWPTLREMIVSGRRLVVMAATGRRDGAPAWFHDAWKIGWETDYKLRPGELVPGPAHCNPNPKDKDRKDQEETPGALLTLNHFVQTAFGISASDVNSYARIVARARKCFGRDKIPNFVTVDFWESGNVVEAVRQINTEIADRSWN
jgi:hypothetical protein